MKFVSRKLQLCCIFKFLTSPSWSNFFVLIPNCSKSPFTLKNKNFKNFAFIFLNKQSISLEITIKSNSFTHMYKKTNSHALIHYGHFSITFFYFYFPLFLDLLSVLPILVAPPVNCVELFLFFISNIFCSIDRRSLLFVPNTIKFSAP